MPSRENERHIPGGLRYCVHCQRFMSVDEWMNHAHNPDYRALSVPAWADQPGTSEEPVQPRRPVWADIEAVPDTPTAPPTPPPVTRRPRPVPRQSPTLERANARYAEWWEKMKPKAPQAVESAPPTPAPRARSFLSLLAYMAVASVAVGIIAYAWAVAVGVV